MKQEFHCSHRYQQVLAILLLCSIIVFILMSVCLMSSYWITTDNFRQGLFFLCLEAKSQNNEPLPFDLNFEDLSSGCYPNRDVPYLRICTCLCVFTQLASLASFILICLTIRVKGFSKIKFLKLAICTTLVTILCDMALVIIYPIQFMKEIDKSNREVWQLNTAYGLAVGSGILSIGVLILLTIVLKRITTNFYVTATPTSV